MITNTYPVSSRKLCVNYNIGQPMVSQTIQGHYEIPAGYISVGVTTLIRDSPWNSADAGKDRRWPPKLSDSGSMPTSGRDRTRWSTREGSGRPHAGVSGSRPWRRRLSGRTGGRWRRRRSWSCQTAATSTSRTASSRSEKNWLIRFLIKSFPVRCPLKKWGWKF